MSFSFYCKVRKNSGNGVHLNFQRFFVSSLREFVAFGEKETRKIDKSLWMYKGNLAGNTSVGWKRVCLTLSSVVVSASIRTKYFTTSTWPASAA